MKKDSAVLDILEIEQSQNCLECQKNEQVTATEVLKKCEGYYAQHNPYRSYNFSKTIKYQEIMWFY